MSHKNGRENINLRMHSENVKIGKKTKTPGGYESDKKGKQVKLSATEKK